MHRAVCWSCDAEGPMEPFLERVRAGETDPRCLLCGGIVKSATISFGQNLVAEDLERAFAAAESAEVLLAVGSSLAVFPVARMVPVALAGGARVVIVNGEATRFDDTATAVVRGAIGEVLPRLVAR
jgi:NAD-dependent deacetylase